MEAVSSHDLVTASEVARAIRTGQVSAREIVERQLGRIEKFNPALNAIVTLDAGNARRRANEADRALAGGKLWGPLHGVPITLKDSFDTAGLRTVSGYRPFARRIPLVDAAPVSRLRQAGAIILGKTNLPALASGIQTNNAVFGRTNNPWDLRRTPGGSSGGAAAAISAGLSFLELGSDIGGSIRIPAHFCGVYGLKTTAGRIAAQGHVASARQRAVPTGCEALFELASFGPIAPSIEDLELVFPIISEPGGPPVAAPVRRNFSELKVAWTEDFGGAPLDADSRRLMRRSIEALTRSGCRIEKCAGPVDYCEAWRISGICLGAINTIFQALPNRWVRRALAPLLQRFRPQHPLMLGLFAGLSLDGKCLRRALEQRRVLTEEVEKFLGIWDCWICPAFPVPAFTHRAAKAPIEVDGEALSQLEANLLHTIIFNMTGHPVVALPIGLSPHGLPIGVQLVGSRWREMEILHAARQIATVVGGLRRAPGY